MNYGDKLKVIRKEFNISQEKLAGILEIDRTTYNHYEAQDKIMPIKHFNAIADYLGLSIDYILDLNNTKQYKNSIKDIDNIKAGMRLKEFRKNFNITQKKLATTLNTTQGVIANYERGRNIIATPFLYTICKKYGVSADYLLGKIDNKMNWTL